MSRKQKRLLVIGGGMSFIFAAVLLVLFALSQSVSYFYMPSELALHPVAPDTRIRLGGLVGKGSIIRDGSTVEFAIVDAGKGTVRVSYAGILPDLFREEQGVITEGKFENGKDVFVADTVLAKHDEQYMPKDVADRLKAQGLWKQDQMQP